jgi:hypothetical protein
LVPLTECGCLIKLTSINKVSGYAYWHMTTAHRWLYQHIHDVVLPSNIDVRHTCDVRICIREDHLIEGTRFQNMQDAKKRDRVKFGVPHHWATINDVMAREIIIAAIGLPQSEVAAIFGVSQPTVSRIVAGRIWSRATADLR